jgi:hypothetical protein
MGIITIISSCFCLSVTKSSTFFSNLWYALLLYESVSKSFRTESITKYTLTFGITRWEAIQRVMEAKLTRLTHKIAIQLHLVAESCTICSSRARRPVRKLLDTPSYVSTFSLFCFIHLPSLGFSTSSLISWMVIHSSSSFLILSRESWSRDSSVGIALGYGLDDLGSRVRFPAGAGNFSLQRRVQNGSGARPTYLMGTTGSFLGGKADQSPPSSAEVKEWVELFVHSPTTPSWRGAQLKKKAQGQLYLLPLPREYYCHLHITCTYHCIFNLIKFSSSVSTFRYCQKSSFHISSTHFYYSLILHRNSVYAACRLLTSLGSHLSIWSTCQNS